MVYRHANRLIQATKILENLGPIGPKPETESQARPLTKLEDAEDQRRAGYDYAKV